MKIRFVVVALVAASALLWSPTRALSQQDVTIEFTGVANPSVQTLGAYAGYYTGTVNGVASTPGFICDDYNDEIFLPQESWQATANSFSSLATSSTARNAALFGNTIGIAGYATIAYLANLMASTPAAGQADIAAAIWYIGTIGSSNPLSFSSLDATAQGYVDEWLGDSTTKGLYDGTYGLTSATAFTSAATAELAGSNLWLYTPIANTQTSGDPYPQEFVGSVAVPEGGTALTFLLLATLFCGGAFFLRNREQVRG